MRKSGKTATRRILIRPYLGFFFFFKDKVEERIAILGRKIYKNKYSTDAAMFGCLVFFKVNVEEIIAILGRKICKNKYSRL